MLRNCFFSAIIVACLVFGVGQGATADEPTPANPIDKFVLDKLRKDSLQRAYATFFLKLQLLRGHLPTPAEMKDFLAAGGTKRAATVEEVLTKAAKAHGWTKDLEQKVRTRILESLLNLDKEQTIDLFPGRALLPREGTTESGSRGVPRECCLNGARGW